MVAQFSTGILAHFSISIYTYIQAKPEIFADYTLKGKVKANRTKFKILGN